MIGIAAVLPALLFAILHVANPEVKEYGFFLAMPLYVIPGILFGLMTILDDGIETAMGTHAANNIFLAIFVTSKASALQTEALLEQQNVDPLKELWVLLILSILSIAILSYKYKWRFSILNKKIAKEAV